MKWALELIDNGISVKMIMGKNRQRRVGIQKIIKYSTLERWKAKSKSSSYLKTIFIYLFLFYSCSILTTMPPAYPAPSPVGYSPFKEEHSKVSLLRVICTGALVRVSTPCKIASEKEENVQSDRLRK